MTIFVKVAKILINKCLAKEYSSSEGKDNGVLGSMFRDAQLSEFQKTTNQELQTQITNYVATEKDEENLQALKALISACDMKIEQRRANPPKDAKEQAKARGHFNQTLVNINSYLERFYTTIASKEKSILEAVEKAETLNEEDRDDKDSDVTSKITQFFLNVPSNEPQASDPFFKFSYWAAYYLGEDIFLPEGDGTVAQATKKIAGISNVGVRTEKEGVLTKIMVGCISTLNALREGKTQQRKNCVLQAIEAINRANKKICEGHKVLDGASFSFTFFASGNVKGPRLQPSKGRLGICMKNAAKDIDPACLDEGAEAGLEFKMY